jgi:hypothetical protein
VERNQHHRNFACGHRDRTSAGRGQAPRRRATELKLFLRPRPTFRARSPTRLSAMLVALYTEWITLRPGGSSPRKFRRRLPRARATEEELTSPRRRTYRGTDGSNPASSSGESCANLTPLAIRSARPCDAIEISPSDFRKWVFNYNPAWTLRISTGSDELLYRAPAQTACRTPTRKCQAASHFRRAATAGASPLASGA